MALLGNSQHGIGDKRVTPWVDTNLAGVSILGDREVVRTHSWHNGGWLPPVSPQLPYSMPSFGEPLASTCKPWMIQIPQTLFCEKYSDVSDVL